MFIQEKANKELSDSDELFGALMKRVTDAQCKLQKNIEDKLRKSQDRDEAMIEELREEVTQLQGTIFELEELSESDDHLHVLQVACLFCDLASLFLHLFCQAMMEQPNNLRVKGATIIQYKASNTRERMYLCIFSDFAGAEKNWCQKLVQNQRLLRPVCSDGAESRVSSRALLSSRTEKSDRNR